MSLAQVITQCLSKRMRVWASLRFLISTKVTLFLGEVLQHICKAHVVRILLHISLRQLFPQHCQMCRNVSNLSV